MLQNLISSAVHPNSNCPHSDPPPPRHYPRPLSLDHIRIGAFFGCHSSDGPWWTSIFFLFFIFFQSRLSYTLKRCFTTSKKFIWLFQQRRLQQCFWDWNSVSVWRVKTIWKRLLEQNSFYSFSWLTRRIQICLDCNPRSWRFRWKAACDLVSLFRIFAANEGFFSLLKWKRRTRKLSRLPWKRH